MPGLNLCGFFTLNAAFVVDAPFHYEFIVFLAAFKANYFLGAFVPQFCLAVCLVLAIYFYFLFLNY